MKDDDNVKASPLHQTDADEDDENVKQLQECSRLYLSLQDCLAENERNWKKCQLGLGLSVTMTNTNWTWFKYLLSSYFS